MIGQLILQIILVLFSAALTCAETAVISVSDSRMEKLTSGTDRRSTRLKKISDSPSRFLATVGAANTLSGASAAAFAAYHFSGRLACQLDKAGTDLSWRALSAAAVIIIILAVSFIMIVFGRTLPKHIAMRSPEKLALRMSGFVRVIMLVFAPGVWIVNAAGNGILRLIGIDPSAQEETVTEEEILMMSDAGAEKGTIDEDENRIIKNVFAFDDMTAGQVCTHRTEVSVLWEYEDISDWEETIHRTRHSVFPVCGESVDNVIGVLDAKDYFRLDDKSRRNIMENAVREPYFVHENMKADRLFEKMKQKGSDHFAVVVDEYGGMSGIITVTDLVEKLVGDFSDDEDDEPQLRMEKTGENTWFIPGSESIADVSDELEITLPADKYDTFGGYVIDELGDIPRDGTQITLEADGLRIEVLEISHHRIEACRVEKILPQEGEASRAES